MTTPFQADCNRKGTAEAQAQAAYYDRKLRGQTCAACGVIRKYHFDTGCRFRRMTEREWAEWCGVEPPAEKDDCYRAVVETVRSAHNCNLYNLVLECGHPDTFSSRLPDGRNETGDQVPPTRYCRQCARQRFSPQSREALKSREDPMEKVTFVPNVPIQVALKFPDGKEVPGRFGDQMMYSLMDGKAMYLDMDVAAKLNMVGPRRGVPFWICKRWTGQKADKPQWDVWPAAPGETAPARQEAPAASVPAPAAVEPPAVTQAAYSDTRNGSTGNGHRPPAAPPPPPPPPPPPANTRPYNESGIPTPPVKIPADIALREIMAVVVESLRATGEQWSDGARQDLVSTMYIQASRDGLIGPWTRGAQ